MNILVLGGHGFIGSHIAEKLESNGHNVTIFARSPSPYLKHNMRWFQGDFLDKGKLSEALINIDIVVHCISTTVPATSAMDPIYDVESNLVGTIQLIELMLKQNITRLVYLSSGGTVYGNPEQNPVLETAQLNPISNYGVIKVAIEKYILSCQFNQGLKPLIFRPSNPYGERQGHNGAQGLISTILNNMQNQKMTTIFGDGTTTRDYIYIKDLASLIAKACDKDICGIFNAGSGIGTTVNEIIELIEKSTGKTIDRDYKDRRGFDVDKIILNIDNAKANFDWNPKIDIASGIEYFCKWRLSH